MNSQLASLLIAVVVLSSLSSEALGFRCYVCNSKNDTACGKGPLEKRFLVDCDTVKYPLNEEKKPYVVCRHQIIDFGGKVTHDRRCGWKMYSKRREVCLASSDNVVKTTMCECHTEGCNSSTSLTVSALTVIATFVTVWLVRH